MTKAGTSAVATAKTWINVAVSVELKADGSAVQYNFRSGDNTADDLVDGGAGYFYVQYADDSAQRGPAVLIGQTLEGNSATKQFKGFIYSLYIEHAAITSGTKSGHAKVDQTTCHADCSNVCTDVTTECLLNQDAKTAPDGSACDAGSCTANQNCRYDSVVC